MLLAPETSIRNGSPPFRIRDAVETDAADIVSIYTPIVTDTTTSFEYDVPTEAEIKRRIRQTQQNFPWLICEAVNAKNGSNIKSMVAGYAYATKHRDREGFQWIADTSIYVSPSFGGQGVGKLLYNKLCNILTQQGYFQAFAIISGKNLGSIAFHKRLGFQCVGEWKNCGNKFGKWCNVSWYAKQLQAELKENPEKTRTYAEIKHLISLKI